MWLNVACFIFLIHYHYFALQILHILYEKDILQEDAILKWASEKEGAEESDRVFVKQSEKFIQVSIFLFIHDLFIIISHVCHLQVK